MKKKALIIIGAVYLLLALFITACMLKRNDYGIINTKKYSYIVTDAIDKYDDNDLIRFPKKSNEYYLDKEAYYYDESKMLRKGTINEIKDNLFTIDGVVNYNVLIIGTPDKSYNLIGGIINTFTNKAIYLIFIILPVFILFVYEIYLFVFYLKETKQGKEDNNETNNITKEKKERKK